MATIRNRIRLYTRDKSKIDELHSFTEHFSFEQIAPSPKTDDKAKTSCSYDNAILERWGTRDEPINSGWVNDIDFIFDTNTTPPIPIFLKILEKFNDIRFEFKFSSEDIGKNCGVLNAANGKVTSVIKFPDYSKLAYETAFELRPHTQYEHKLNAITNTYEYNIEDIVECVQENGVFSEDRQTELILLDANGNEVL